MNFWEILLIVFLVLLLFGGRSLPEMMRHIVERCRSLNGRIKKSRDTEPPVVNDVPIDRTDKVLDPDQIRKTK